MAAYIYGTYCTYVCIHVYSVYRGIYIDVIPLVLYQWYTRPQTREIDLAIHSGWSDQRNGDGPPSMLRAGGHADPAAEGSRGSLGP